MSLNEIMLQSLWYIWAASNSWLSILSKQKVEAVIFACYTFGTDNYLSEESYNTVYASQLLCIYMHVVYFSMYSSLVAIINYNNMNSH